MNKLSEISYWTYQFVLSWLCWTIIHECLVKYIYIYICLFNGGLSKGDNCGVNWRISWWVGLHICWSTISFVRQIGFVNECVRHCRYYPVGVYVCASVSIVKSMPLCKSMWECVCVCVCMCVCMSSLPSSASASSS